MRNSSRLVAADRAAAADGRGGQQHRQHQHHRLQGRGDPVRRIRDAGRPRPATSRTLDQPLSFTQDWATIHDMAPAARSCRPATRSTSRSRATASSPSQTPAGERWTRSGAFQINADGHAGRPQRQPGDGRRRPDPLRRQRDRHHDRADGAILDQRRRQGPAAHRRVRRSAGAGPRRRQPLLRRHAACRRRAPASCRAPSRSPTSRASPR